MAIDPPRRRSRWPGVADDAAFVPERVRQARHATGMSQRTLADLLAVRLETVVGLEEGRVAPAPGDIDRLVSIFRHPAAFYFKPIVEHFPAGSVFFHYRDDGAGGEDDVPAGEGVRVALEHLRAALAALEGGEEG